MLAGCFEFLIQLIKRRGKDQFSFTVHFSFYKTSSKILLVENNAVCSCFYFLIEEIKVNVYFYLQGFILEFHFETNEYFQETVLTKQYTMRFEQDPADPFSYEGPEIIKCQG